MPKHHTAFSGAAALALLGLATMASRGVGAPARSGAVDFARDIQPILATSCIRCHAGAVAQGGLRLDTAEGLGKGGASGAAVVPGDGKASILHQRLVLNDPQKRMPWLTDPLPAGQIEAVRQWIDEGAHWPDGVVVTTASSALPVAPRPSDPPSPIRGDATAPSRNEARGTTSSLDEARGPAPLFNEARGPAPLFNEAMGPAPLFNRDVRPILAANCYACHGPDRNNRQAGLRLDREEPAKTALPTGHVAIVPGEPDRSEILRRVTHPDEQQRMPHVSSGKARLSAAQIDVLRRWIEHGAPWQPHWSYIKPVRPELPTVRKQEWPKNPLDAFVLAGIERAGLQPSREAPPRELLRRLSLDLIGLPPTPEEVRAFLEDKAQGAYEREVDRLLASPRFGERMAVSWLDLVRYADSVGYHSDNARTVWRYRDWVVDAFNRNLRFDRFTAEQLAGDLMPNATDVQKIASGYNRLLQTTEEGGAQPREYRAIYLADRVRNASTVWLAGTLGCAQCHDHKFDPYLARDFASFGAFFADVKEAPVGRRQPDFLPSASQRPQLDAIEARIDALKQDLKAASPERETAQQLWETTVRDARVISWTTLEPVEASSANGTRVMIQGNDFSLIAAAGPRPPRDTYSVRFKTALKGMTAFRLEAVTFEELPKGGPGRHPEGGFVVTELALKDGDGRPIPLRNASASTPAADGVPGEAIDGHRGRGGWTLLAADGQNHRLVVEAAQPVGTTDETTITLVLHQSAGEIRTLGRFKLSATADALPVNTKPGLEPGGDIQSIARTEGSQRTREQSDRIAAFYSRAAPELAPVRAQLRAAELERDALAQQVAQSLVTTTQDPEPVRILPRGNWLDESGDVVEPAVPHFLPPLEGAKGRATRLDLARWITSPENPLTARVFVNRLWKGFFGQGLSTTLQDLGSQGEWPTHPELLDWLAVEFMESGWDVKHAVRTLVTSATYRQSSGGSPALLESDPYNRLYARQLRFRLDAEVVRDNALAISGLLSPRMGGPSVHPYQPRGYWTYLNFPPREWDDDTGEDQYRRGLYTWWQRTFPQPSLLAFDAPSREECVAERTRSNIPQQALALLNDPTHVEAARVLAERMLARGGPRFDDRVRWAFERALARPPRAEELKVLADLHRRHRAQYRNDRRAAAALAAIGQSPVPKGVDVVDLAAWTSVARVILNLPEVITRF